MRDPSLFLPSFIRLVDSKALEISPTFDKGTYELKLIGIGG
jgi:hypothetical protein